MKARFLMREKFQREDDRNSAVFFALMSTIFAFVVVFGALVVFGGVA